MSYPGGPGLRTLATFRVPSVPGNERLAFTRVADAVAGEGMSARQIDRLKTAVAEATLNAIEHGNGFDPATAADIEVLRDGPDVVVTVTDSGGGRVKALPDSEPDLAAKLAGEQEARGWGLFLIRHMVDAMEVTSDGQRRTVRLTMRAGDPASREAAETGPSRPAGTENRDGDGLR